MARTEDRKKSFLEALKRRLGIIAAACKDSGLPRNTYYRYYDKDRAFKEKVDEIIDEQVDYVENCLIQRIREGDTTAIIFYLKTKGKKRGYSGSDDKNNTTINVNVVEE